MSESSSVLGGNALPHLATELDVTRESFERIGLPEGYARRRLGEEYAGAYVALDDWASFIDNPDTPKDHEPDPFMIEDIAESMREGDIFEGIFDADDNLIATMWLSPQPEKDSLEVANLVVERSQRDKGIGAYFLQAAEDIAKIRGFSSCNLHVDPFNSRGMYLYMMRLGYRPTAYEHSNDYGLKNWLIMTKQLDEGLLVAETPMIEVNAGDEARLADVIAQGYSGIGYTKADGPHANPKNATISFAKIANHEPR